MTTTRRLRPMLRLALIPVAAALLGGCDWQRAKFQQTTTASAPHAASAGVAVHTRNGFIEVHKGSTADGQVSIAATLRMTTQDRLGQATIQANRDSAGVLEVEAKPPEGGWRSGEGCDFAITLPDASGVDLKTENGHIEIAGLSGNAKLETSNGRVTIHGHDGPIQAQTRNGRIQAEDVSGAVDAETSNGSIHIQLAGRGGGPVKAITSNGAVTLGLSSTFRGELEVSTSNGSVHMPSSPPAGVSKFTSRVDRHSAHLSVGEGGPSSTIRTSNGSVTVKFGG